MVYKLPEDIAKLVELSRQTNIGLWRIYHDTSIVRCDSNMLNHVKPINFHRISPAPHGAHGAQVQLATRLAPLRRRLPGPRGAEHRCGRSSVARRAGAAGRHGDQGAAGGHGAAERRLGELRCGEKARAARGNGQ